MVRNQGLLSGVHSRGSGGGLAAGGSYPETPNSENNVWPEKGGEHGRQSKQGNGERCNLITSTGHIPIITLGLT